jgi:hypothetical protein
MRPYATSVSGLKLLVYAALTYYCMRNWAVDRTSMVKLLVYEAFSV